MFSVKKSNIFHFFCIIILLFGSFVVGTFFLTAHHIFSINKDSIAFFGIFLPQLFLVLGPVLFFLGKQKGFWQESLYRKNPGWVNLIMAILLTWVLIPTVSLLSTLSMFFVKNQISDVMLGLTGFPYWLGILTIAIFPGIFEELQTRFILLNNYRYKPYFIACLMSGLFFGILHMNVNQFIYATFLGIIFAFLVQITESMYTSIAMHITLNATTFSIGYFFMENPAMTEVAEASGNAELWDTAIRLAGINLITLPIAYLIIRFLIKYNGKVGILKQKPTVLELTLGRKIPEFDPNQPINWLYDEKGNPCAVIQPQPSVAASSEFSIYPPTQDSPFPNGNNIPSHRTNSGNPDTIGNSPLSPVKEQNDMLPHTTSYDYTQNDWIKVGNKTISSEQAAIEIYLARFQSPFNWGFWASVGLFALMVLVFEIAVYFKH